ncbi:large ribosomal subunit protein uL2m isoform X1 [Tamandua tetradactyla]|uniref:large ribosomal subunit protein uL2m isoform X1 n=1 Tax=Tamandua tetradactyla TaxID=48850 RepID=UPI0040546C1F
MAASRGNCFDGSEGRGLFPRHKTSEAPEDWLWLSEERRCVSGLVSSSLPPSFASLDIDGAGNCWCHPGARRGLATGESGVRTPVDSDLPYGPTGSDPYSGLPEPFASARRHSHPFPEPAPRRPGRIRVHGIGGGHKQRYRMIDFLRFRPENESKPGPFEEKVINVRYDPCRSADIALVAGGSRKRWIIATENMQAGDIILNSDHIGRMAVAAREGDAHPLGALPVGTLINNVESEPGRGAQYIRAAGTCGVLLRKVNGTAIIQLPSKRQMQVLETCVATVGRVSNVDHNKRIIGKAGRNRWLGKRPNSGLWHRKGGWAGRKIRPLPPMKSYVKLPSAAAQS